MQIGIVTPAYNVAPFIGEAIQSVLSQTHTDWRMAVVDDASRDETAALVGLCPDRRIILIQQAHAGVSAARNSGIALLDVDALLFLDADDWLAPDALAVLAQTLEDAPWATTAVGAYARARSNPPPITAPVYRAFGSDLLPRLLIRNLFANGGHLLIRREAVEATGGFRTDLHYGEDWEYWIRIALRGEFSAARVQHPLCFVRERPGSAYLRLADDPGSLLPCLNAVYGNPELRVRFTADHLRKLRRRAEAENAWVVGRELIRHGRNQPGRVWLRRSAWAAPGLKRIALTGLSCALTLLPEHWRGPFRPYQQFPADHVAQAEEQRAAAPRPVPLSQGRRDSMGRALSP